MMLTRRRLLQALPLALVALPTRSHAAALVRPTRHPLNHPARCAGWWLATPLAGHASWADLVHGHVGVTTGVSAGFGLQRSTRRPGGWGELLLDGVDDTTLLPDLLDNAPQLSLSLWVRAPLAGVRQALVTKSLDYTSSAPGWYLVIHSNNVLGLWLVTDGSNYLGINGTLALTDGLWHHVVGVVSDWATLALWVDGVPDPTSETFSVGTLTSIGTATSVRLGTFGNGTSPFQGSVDDMRLYNTGLADHEIQTLAQAPRQQYAGLLGTTRLLARVPTPSTRVRGPGLLFQ